MFGEQDGRQIFLGVKMNLPGAMLTCEFYIQEMAFIDDARLTFANFMFASSTGFPEEN